MEAGIDDIALFIPRLYVDYRDFADARSVSREKLEKGIGVKQMAIPDSDEDTATMAATACLRLMRKNNLSPKNIGRIDIATEGGLDESKPLTTYVIGMLEQVYGKGSFQHCMGVEYKSACVAGSRALLDSVNWINSGENKAGLVVRHRESPGTWAPSEGRAAIVIASDIAKYDIGSPGEYTQGAGAVAMLVTENPRLVSLDRGVASWVMQDDYDFYRPHGHETPIVNGKHSLDCYVEQVARAFRGFKGNALQTGAVKNSHDFTGAIDYFAFHLPFPKMGKKALERILAEEYVDEITHILGPFGPLLTNERDMLGDKSKLMEILRIKKSENVFRQKVEPSVIGCAHVGNIYTGSVFLSLASILDTEHNARKSLAGRRVVFLSYGSGSSAVVYSGVIGEGYADAIGRGIVAPALEGRQRLSMEQYGALHRKETKEPVAEKRDQFVLKSKDGEGRRHYAYNK
ncbi:MAG: hydroxymethylglutaryl-CoA synthase [Nanoarchaeota archaeon]|nr:hydroxymethylglutaryl-CoA synthase [Nanoarchaeota archaeon]